MDNAVTEQILGKRDIICLVETHCNYSDTITLKDYSTIMNIRPKSAKATKFSGGIAICVKNLIKPGISFMPITNTEYMWFKLKKEFFNLECDLYVACVYICPIGSSYSHKTNDIFEALEADIAEYSKKGKCLLCGVFNGRTCTAPDYCLNDSVADIIDVPYNYVEDVELPRSNCDLSKPDHNGVKVLYLCKSSGLRIVNGRCVGDAVGFYTCFSHNGSPSVIDYMLLSSTLLDMVEMFHVHDPDPDNMKSIHGCMTLVLKTAPYNYIHTTQDNSESLKSLLQFKWREAIDNEVATFSEILIETAKKTGIKLKLKKQNSKSPNTRTKSCTTKKFKWYNADCAKIKRELTNLSKQIQKDPHNTSYISNFRKLRKCYKNTIRKNKLKYEQEILENLESMQSRNPKEFWKTFNTLKSLESKHKENPIPANEWIAHFTSLMNKNLNVDTSVELKFTKFINENKHSSFNELNFKITEEEIQKAIMNLKINKASGIDGILNEMLKSSSQTILPHLCQLFNHILISNHFPDAWRINTLTPLHKKGNINLTEN